MALDKERVKELVSRGVQFVALDKGKKYTKKEGWPAIGWTDPDIMATSPKDWGINCGLSGLVGIDVDIKNGGNGLAELAALEEKYGKLPKTYTSRTPSKGMHLVFRGIIRSDTKNAKLADSIDIRAEGGLLVSELVDGYECIDDSEFAPLPDWVEFEIQRRRGDKGPINLEKDPILYEGDRDTELHRIGSHIRGMGCSESEILTLLTSINEERCDPPVEDWQVRKVARQAAEYSTNQAKEEAQRIEKNIQRQKDFELKEEDEDDESRPIHSCDFQGEAPPRDWLLNQWLPMGEISSIYGGGGSGKSLIAAQLAYAIAYGQPWLGMDIKKTMPVLAVMCEDDKNELHRRLNNIRASNMVDNTGSSEDGALVLWSRVGKDTMMVSEGKDGLEAGYFYKLLEEYLANMPEGPKFLILDTLSDIFCANENNREIVNRFIKFYLGGLVKRYELTVLFVAHPSRSGMASGDHLSGTTGWENSVRCRLVLKEHKDYEGVMILERGKSNYAKKGAQLLVKWQDGVFVPADEDVVREEHVSGDPRIKELVSFMEDREIAKFTEYVDFAKRDRAKLRRDLEAILRTPLEADGYLYRMVKGRSDHEDARFRFRSVFITKKPMGSKVPPKSDDVCQKDSEKIEVFSALLD